MFAWTPQLNYRWLDSAIRRGDAIYLATDPTNANVVVKKWFQMELNYLEARGYVQQGLYMVKK